MLHRRSAHRSRYEKTRFFSILLVAGAAAVYVASDREVDAELEHFLDPEHRCANGTVRIYRQWSAGRRGNPHRYFRPEEIRAQGADVIEARIVEALVRRAHVSLGAGVATLADVRSLDRQARLDALKRSSRDSEEYTSLLEEENDKLRATAQERGNALAAERDRAEEAELQLEDTNKQFEAEKAKLEASAKELGRAKAAADAERERALLWATLKLPATPAEVLSLAAAVYPERLAILPSALKSAEVASEREPALYWRYVNAIANELYDLVFSGGAASGLARRFKELTGIDMVLRESDSTTNNRRLAQARRASYKGTELDCSPHLKYGNSQARAVRIHFGISRTDRRIVISHCGNHLDTSRTS